MLHLWSETSGPVDGTLAVMRMSLESLAATRRLVAKYVPTTPSYAWPLLARATGADVWVKHENHTPTGAFKVRGGLNFLSRLIA